MEAECPVYWNHLVENDLLGWGHHTLTSHPWFISVVQITATSILYRFADAPVTVRKVQWGSG